MRRLRKTHLGKRILRWGIYDKGLLVVVTRDYKMMLIDHSQWTYETIPDTYENRAKFLPRANRPGDYMTLYDLLSLNWDTIESLYKGG